MSTLVLYATQGGTTRKVAQRVASQLGAATLVDVGEAGPADFPKPDRVLLFCPTYGDAEFEDSFERFLYSFDWAQFAAVEFAFCELGIYTGYEEFGHGLVGPLYARLSGHGLRPILPPLSLDTVPVTDWKAVDEWAEAIVARSGWDHE